MDVNLETIIDMLSSYNIWLLKWIYFYPWKTKTFQENKKTYKSSSSPSGKQTSFTLTIPQNLTKLVNIFLGIIVRQPFTVHKQMGLLRRVYARLKIKLCCTVAITSGWKMVGGSHGFCLCLRNIQDFFVNGKTLYGWRFGEPFKRSIISFGSMAKYHPISSRDQSRIHKFGGKERTTIGMDKMSKLFISEVPTLWNFRTGPMKGSSDVPEGRLGILSKNIYKRKEKDKATFPWENGYFRLRQQKSWERRSSVDSGASMHMANKKDLNSAELETMRTSRSPTTVMTTNDEVQTREKATVYVKPWDLFVNVMLLEETSAVLSLGTTLWGS